MRFQFGNGHMAKGPSRLAAAALHAINRLSRISSIPKPPCLPDSGKGFEDGAVTNCL